MLIDACYDDIFIDCFMNFYVSEEDIEQATFDGDCIEFPCQPGSLPIGLVRDMCDLVVAQEQPEWVLANPSFATVKLFYHIKTGAAGFYIEARPNRYWSRKVMRGISESIKLVSMEDADDGLELFEYWRSVIKASQNFWSAGSNTPACGVVSCYLNQEELDDILSLVSVRALSA